MQVNSFLHYLLLVLGLFAFAPGYANAEVSYQSFASATGTGNSVSVNKPTGTATGDLLLLSISFEKGSDVSITATGWTLVRRTDQSTNVGMATYFRVAAADEATSYTFTLTQGPKWSAAIARFTGVSVPASPATLQSVGNSSGTSSTSVVAPAITTTDPNAIVLAVYTNKKNSTYTAATGTTERFDVPNTGGLPSLMLATYPQATAASTGTKTATATDSEVWAAQQIALYPIPANAAQSTITANPTSILADNTTTSTITVQLKSAAGATLTTTGQSVFFTTTAGTLSSTSATTTNGVASVTLKGASAGTATVRAYLGTSATDPQIGGSSGVTVTFLSIVNPTITANSALSQSAVVGTAVATPPSVKVLDTNGNPVSGRTITFAIASGGGSLTGSSATTGSDGVATLGSWTLGTTAGANTVTASGDNLIGSPITFSATGTAGAAVSLTKVSTDPQTTTINTAVSSPPSVKVVDQYGNGVPGQTVTFAVTSGGGAVTGAVRTTDSNGIATAGSWILGPVAGSNALTATRTGLTTVTFAATGPVRQPGPAAWFRKPVPISRPTRPSPSTMW